MKKIEIRIYNREVVDCSTGFVNIIPEISTLKLLLEMVQKLLEADFIKAVASFDIQFLEDSGTWIKYSSPYIGDEYDYKNKNYNKYYNIKDEDIKKQSSLESREDKTFGFYIESFKSATSRRDGIQIIQAGLKGIKDLISEIVSNLENNKNVVFLSLAVDIGFVEGTSEMTRILLDSRRELITLIFNSDGLPLPEEAYEVPIFFFIGRNVFRTINKYWPDMVNIENKWSDDDLMETKAALRAIDDKDKLNQKASFYDSWYLSALKDLIIDDNKTNNVVAIYRSGYLELLVIVENLLIVPKIDTYGIIFTTYDRVDMSKIKKEDLLYGTHLRA